MIAVATIPFAFIGGFISLWVTGTTFGISAGIGFIILFGVNTINAIILIAVMKQNFREMPLKDAVKKVLTAGFDPL